jgi:hypothetical protein
MPNFEKGLADSQARPALADHKTDYQDEPKALHLPPHEFSFFYDCFIGDAPSYISAPTREVQP